MEARHFIVRGRVQGVGFRFFAEREARRAGVQGWVRNRADGAVETLAIGERGALENFRRRLEQGPPAARVAGVETEPAELSPEEMRAYRGFGIADTE